MVSSSDALSTNPSVRAGLTSSASTCTSGWRLSGSLGMLCPGWRQARTPGSPQLFSGSPYLMIVRGWLVHSPWPCHPSGTDLLWSSVVAVLTFSAPLEDNFFQRPGQVGGMVSGWFQDVSRALYSWCTLFLLLLHQLHLRSLGIRSQRLGTPARWYLTSSAILYCPSSLPPLISSLPHQHFLESLFK